MNIPLFVSRSLRLLFGVLLLSVLVTGLSAQTAHLDTTAVDFGTVAIGQASAMIPLNFTFDSGGTIGNPIALTQGVAGLDFAVATGGTCMAGSYSAGDTCTVNVIFTPNFAGLRNGAVILTNASGNSIATGYVHGIGSGPQVSFLPGSSSTLGGGFSDPWGIAVDGSGNIFVADPVNYVLKEIPPGCGAASCVKTLISGQANNFQPRGIALDASGNVFAADVGNGAVEEIPLGCVSFTCVKRLGSGSGGYGTIGSVAVDWSGNVFFTDSGDSVVHEILAAGGYTTVKALGSGFYLLGGISVDGSGNVFVTDQMSDVVKEIVAAGGYTTVNTLGSGFGQINGIAVDGNGNVFVADAGDNVVREILAAGGYATIKTLGSGFGQSIGIAVDGSGNIFVAVNPGVEKLDFADAPSLSFGSINTGEDSAGQTVSLQNIGNGPLTLPVPATGSNPSVAQYFELDSSGSTACPVVTSSSSVGSLASGASCTLAISFAPTISGNINGSLVLTDDALNAASPTYALQTIALQGTGVGLPAQTITFPNPGTQTYGVAPITLTATASSGLAVSYSVTSGPATVNGTTLTITGPGSVTLQATQSGNTNYSAAPAVSVTFAVNKAPQTITFPNPGPQTYGVAPIALTASASSGLAVSYSVTSGPATVNGSTLTITGPGSVTLQATQSGNPNYAAAAPINASFTVAAAPAPTYTLTAGSPTVSMAAGSSSTVLFNLRSTNYAGTVVLAASDNSQISASAPSVALTNGGSGSSTLTITTQASAANHGPATPWNGRSAVVFCAVLLGLPFGVRRRRACAVLLAALAISLAGFLMACGATNSQSSRLSRTYIVNVTPTGSGAVTNPTAVSIVVTVQ